LKLRPARRLPHQSARGWRSRAHQARPSAASAVTIRRSFAEDFVLGGGATLSREDQGIRPSRRRHLNEDRALARRAPPARQPCARRDGARTAWLAVWPSLSSPNASLSRQE